MRFGKSKVVNRVSTGDDGNIKKAIMENLGRLTAARSAAETAEILKAAGEDISPEVAEQLFREFKEHTADGELSPDELEAVSGGGAKKRDWATEGCAATVEHESFCSSNDGCFYWDVSYKHFPTSKKCRCGTYYYFGRTEDGNLIFVCKSCGCKEEDPD